jgi:hypothetical protein
MSQPGKDNITEFVKVMQTTVLRIRIRDPVPFNLWIRVSDGKKSRSGMNIPNLIF